MLFWTSNCCNCVTHPRCLCTPRTPFVRLVVGVEQRFVVRLVEFLLQLEIIVSKPATVDRDPRAMLRASFILLHRTKANVHVAPLKVHMGLMSYNDICSCRGDDVTTKQVALNSRKTPQYDVLRRIPTHLNHVVMGCFIIAAFAVVIVPTAALVAAA